MGFTKVGFLLSLFCVFSTFSMQNSKSCRECGEGQRRMLMGLPNQCSSDQISAFFASMESNNEEIEALARSLLVLQTGKLTARCPDKTNDPVSRAICDELLKRIKRSYVKGAELLRNNPQLASCTKLQCRLCAEEIFYLVLTDEQLGSEETSTFEAGVDKSTWEHI